VRALIDRVNRLAWYHTIDLGHGVVTPGVTDHRPYVRRYQLPASLAGLRCLDVGSLDGFWAFEMERRGAAEVVATDVPSWDAWDIPGDGHHVMPANQGLGDAFEVAHEALGSAVSRELCSVYELSPERVGKFDLVLVSDVLAHLRDPELALERIFGVCRGQVLVAEVYSSVLDGYRETCLVEFKGGPPPDALWVPNTNTFKEMMRVAGFEQIEELARFVWSARGRGSDGQPVVNRAHKVILRAQMPEAAVASGAPGTRMRKLRLHVRSMEIGIALPAESRAARIADSAGYRGLLRPLVKRVTRPAAGRPATEIDEEPAPRLTPIPSGASPETRALVDRINKIWWYHTIDLGEGIATAGWTDDRDQVGHHGLPESLRGLRCLDVANWDGFWAFEMERRGASEVVAIDIERFDHCDIPARYKPEKVAREVDHPTGTGFRLAQEVLGSGVRRETCNVYDLSPDRLGFFDIVIVSDLLLHLRDPQLALERIHSVCRGTTLVAEVYDPNLEDGRACLTRFMGGHPGNPFLWWLPSASTHRRMMSAAGFSVVHEISRFRMSADSTVPLWKIVLRGEPGAGTSGSLEHLAASVARS
jgi:tRNA (mo5U34)-methyltransferase